MCRLLSSSPLSACEATTAAKAAPSSRRKWMTQSIVKRTVPKVHNYMESLIDSTPFLQRQAQQDTTAVLHRSEVQVGDTPLGSGGFSDVHAVTGIVLDPEVSARCTPIQQRQRQSLVQNVQTGRCQYAIKMLQAKLLQSPQEFTQAAYDLVAEGQYLERLCHPNIIELAAVPVDGIDAWKSGEHDGYFLLLERLDCTLADRIKEWKKPESSPLPTQHTQQQLECMSQVAEALRYLRHHRLCFRDLKPANLGLTHTGHVVLFDFGLCRQLPADVDAIEGLYEMSGVGTQRYMAPEVLRDSRYDQQADVYSFAMIMWEILTGVRPFLRYGIEEHRQAVCFEHERPRILPKWTTWTRVFLENSWHSDPFLRWDMDTIIGKLQDRLFVAQPSPVSVACDPMMMMSWGSKSMTLTVDPDLFSFPILDDDDNSASSLPAFRLSFK